MKKYSKEWWAAQRPEVVGRETEKLVISVLEELNTRQNFAWHRLPDAKAARGLLSAQPADMVVADGKKGLFLEVKAIKHAFRLPKDKVRQLPLLKKFAESGMGGVILVHHYLEGIWRVVDPESLDLGVPSWDISPAYGYSDVREALNDALLGD